MRARPLLALALLLSVVPASPASSAPREATYLRTPLAFEANRGQAASDVRFLAHGPGYTMLFAPAAIEMRLHANAGTAAGARSAVVGMRFVGGAEEPAVTGGEQLAGYGNYLVGNDRTRWATHVPLFARVRYAGVYPGIDALFYGDQRQLEYDLVVAPGADPETIVLAFAGTDRVTVDADGALVLRANGGDVIQRKPVVYQMIDGTRRNVDGAFVPLGRRAGEERVGLRIARYDRTRPLVIDPVVAYATYLGGPSQNDGRAIAVDTNGNAYVTGTTNSATFPNVGGLPDPNDDLQGSQDAFVTKLGPTGTLIYSTYLGGTDSDAGNGIAVDDQGSAYVVGETSSADFPTANPLPAPNNALQITDGFVTKLGPNGDALVYSTFLGGSASNEKATAVAVDATRNAYVVGIVFSSENDFPTVGTLPNNVNHGVTDVFVSKFATNGSSLVYSDFIGGSGADTALGVAVRNGEAYVTGRTQSPNFPYVSGLPAPNNGLRGFSDGFVTKLNAAGSAITYSTYLSGSGDVDDGNGIAIDTDGNAYVGGKTESNNLLSSTTATGSLPAPNAAFRGGADGYVVKLGANGNTLGFLAFLGGSTNAAAEEINGIALDGTGGVWVTGQTDSNNFPVEDGLGLQNRRGQNNAGAIVARLATSGDAIQFSSYLGGTRNDVGRGIAVTSGGDAFVVGQTISSDFPVVNAAQPTHGAGAFNPDAFVAKITGNGPPVAFTPGNVFVSAVDFGEVREYTPTGTLVRALPLPSGAFTDGSSPAGIAFDHTGNLYVADLTQKTVFQFDPNGDFVGPFVSGITSTPQSLVFDAAGNLFVGTIDTPSDVLRYSSNGQLLQTIDVFVHDTGAFWFDLAADQQTIFYTSRTDDIAVYDSGTNTQLADFFIEDVSGFLDFGVRLMPNGGALLAGRNLVRRLDQNGAVTKTFTPVPDVHLFQVSRDPDGQTIWSASDGQGGSADGLVMAFDLTSAAIVHQFTGAASLDRPPVGGLAVFGELTEAVNGSPVAGTPTPLATRTPAPEICDDCIDNDNDGQTDRDDLADCPPARADGAGAGLNDPKGTGKAIVKCGKALTNAGTKLASSRQKHLQKCVTAAFTCIQQKPTDAKCQAKATKTCGKELGKLPTDITKLTGKITKACGAPKLTVDDLRIATGLGYDSEFGTPTSVCAARGVASLTTANDVAACVLAEDACRADNLVGVQVPRAAELMRFAGRDPDAELPCLNAPSDGGGTALVPSAKAAVKCQKTIAKAGAKYASTVTKLRQKCTSAVYTCLEQKPLDPKCQPKAVTGCTKTFIKLNDGTKGAIAKVRAALATSCTKAPLTLAEVLQPKGLGFGDLFGECRELGVPSFSSIDDVATCVVLRSDCRLAQMLEIGQPRTRELIDIAFPPGGP